MKNRKLCIFAIIALAFAVTACKPADGGGGGGGDSGYWLISSQSTSSYNTDGEISNYSVTQYDWIAYRYTNETNYEEQYTTRFYSNRSYGSRGDNNSFSDHHYSRNGQTSYSTTETISRTDSPPISVSSVPITALRQFILKKIPCGNFKYVGGDINTAKEISYE